MYRLFCCRNRKTSRVEVDDITDSLERCLSVERGISEFRSFLESKRFNEESTTLTFALKCQQILSDISRLSLTSRRAGLPQGIHGDIRDLREMANNYINFDSSQMDALKKLESTDVEEIVRTLEVARNWAVDLLRDVYNTFRSRTLANSIRV